ncbi:DUF695 domain-containing protein [Shewanella maritima]|uniref:DUF695 domain-containing protein n=1 Tax=Shewanella maritima TaxID=2520507 RepID=A0A411PD21_9GAMM|nr:DUF695 domain-containing protein [Shewanella maritima]QBF81497.1 DUF695 domain-containing protein [Shewanella maritima]
MSNWDFYKANINQNIASIYLDLDAKLDLEENNLDTLSWLFIKLKYERDDGLSHDDEFDALCDYEDNIENAIEGSEIHYVGRITTNGMRQFYFYSADSSLFEKVINDVLDSKSDYLYQIGSKPDPEWNQFKNVLYPGEHGLNQIQSREGDT